MIFEIDQPIRDPDNPLFTGVVVDIEVPEMGGGYYVRWDHMPVDSPAEWAAERDLIAYD